MPATMEGVIHGVSLPDSNRQSFKQSLETSQSTLATKWCQTGHRAGTEAVCDNLSSTPGL